MSTSLIIVLSAAFAVGVFAITWVILADHKRRTIRIDGNFIFVGPKSLDATLISRVEVASLYDVAPADDLWVITGKNENTISFFNRHPDAAKVLEFLENLLPGFVSNHALDTARSESVFEEPVTVWQSPLLLDFTHEA